MLDYLFFGAPVALFALLVSMPKGRPALYAILGTALCLVAIWLYLRLSAVQDGTMQTVGFFGVMALTLAWFMGSTLQFIRLRMPQTWPRWAWPVCVLIVFGSIALLLARFFGF
ncbi:MAG: hypothetical protein AAGA28_02385 [Pseudomonadota bacterium]